MVANIAWNVCTLHINHRDNKKFPKKEHTAQHIFAQSFHPESHQYRLMALGER
jgi:hypothetical protein